tara:strand:- start:213 stop:338 length:126 start_codon:yes stop_codon:yes gene_type:complete
MKEISKAAKLGKQFKKAQIIFLILFPTYFIGRVLMSLIFDI